MSKPSHWPRDIQYLDSLRFHSTVTPTVRSYLCGDKARSGPNNQNSRSWVIIRSISLASHPACGQYGLFASKKIPPRAHIMDYIGEVHCDDRPHSDYDLSLYRSQTGENVGIDASSMGNEARFINDYRGIREKPNAYFQDGWTSTGELRMSIWSGQAVIKKGEEILVSYGKSWWRERVPMD